MCGITGIFYPKKSSRINCKILETMNNSLAHRGPDDAGTYIEDYIGLGHRRLSIIDLSNGHQPVFNEDGSVVVVYNGEIYNFNELMQELVKAGHSFKTRCDTEVIVHAWEEWGEKCVERFRGMFAFAIWDIKKKCLFMARDRLGVKPLYYAYTDDGGFIFASELKAITTHPEFTKILSPESVEDYFAFGYIPEPKSIFKNAFKLEPGFTLTYYLEQPTFKLNKYWDIPFENSNIPNNAEDLQHELIERLDEAVKIRLIAEVPLGAFLSGGVDSSATVALMDRHLPNMTTCSVEFNEKEFNEGTYARIIAEKFKTNHFYEKTDINDFSLIDKLANVYDEPFADSSALPTYKLCELTKKHVTVALSGDGGDENFAGYSWYNGVLQREKIRNTFSPLAIKITNSLFNPVLKHTPGMSKFSDTLQKLSLNPVKAYSQSMMISSQSTRNNLFTKDFKQQLNGYTSFETIEHHAKQAPTDDMLSLAQYLDFKVYLSGDILTKVDRASMAHSLEVRVPILDHKFVEWASGIPSNLKRQGKNGKYIFKKSLEALLPNDTLYRKKMGFSVPLNAWFKSDLKNNIENIISNSPIIESNIINRSFVRGILDKHVKGEQDNSTILYSILMFDEFYTNAFS